MAATQFPGKGIASTGDDLLNPLEELLRGLNILPVDKKKDSTDPPTGSLIHSPDPSAAAIESTATALTKVWTVALSALGGTAAVSTVATGFWNGLNGNSRLVLLGGMAVVVASTVIGLAVVISADLRARSGGMAAIYSARARVAVEFLTLSLSATQRTSDPVVATSGTLTSLDVPLLLSVNAQKAQVTLKGSGKVGNLAGVRVNGNITEIRYIGPEGSPSEDDWITTDKISEIKLTYPYPPG